MPKLKSQTTDSERANYIEVSLNMDHLLAKTISLLTTRRNLTTDSNEILTIDVEIPSLEAEQGKIRADLIAFLAGVTAINPPTQAQVDLIKLKSASLDAMIANSKNANSMIALATAAVNEWKKTRPV